MNRLLITFALTLFANLTLSHAQADDCTSCGVTVDTDHTVVSEGPQNGGPDGPESENPDGDRIIYFAHGHTGNETSWVTAQSHVLANNSPGDIYERVKRCENHAYVSTIGLDQGTALWQQHLLSKPQCEQENIDITQNFVIAHSFGGLVAKNTYGLEAEDGYPIDERRFSGLITFDTPHAGAGFAENINGLGDFMSSGCEALSIGPTSAAYTSLPVILQDFLGVTGPITVTEVTDRLCGGIGTIINEVFPFVAGPLDPDAQDGLIGTVIDLRPNSDAIAAVNALEAIPNKLAIGCNETAEGSIWRTMLWATTRKTTSFPFGESNLDDALLLEMDTMLAHYADQANSYMPSPNYTPCIVAFFGGPGAYQSCRSGAFQRAWNRGAWARSNYARGEQWIASADHRWGNLAGFNQLNTTTVPGTGDCDCLVENLPNHPLQTWQPLPSGTVNSDLDCQSRCYTTNWPGNGRTIGYRYDGTRTQIVSERQANDGIVTRESQLAWPGAVEWEFEDSNHMQVRSDNTTRKVFERAIEGDAYEFFKSNYQ
ncbi:MAG: hypothetical protein AB8F78_17620 [Saprospiraceae bacterium]